MKSEKPVTISYTDYKEGKDLNDAIGAAFGKTGLGLVVISDLPDFQKERYAALRSIRQFANLPDEVKDKYTHPQSNYSFGWSHGKERMRNGVPDTAKGSYYANPLGDKITSDSQLKSTYPELYSDNIWPTEELSALQSSFKGLTSRQLEVGYLVCDLFDKYLGKLTSGAHSEGSLLAMLKRGRTCKGRMLHYFPVPEDNCTSEDGLCGWHLDHGGVTILTCPLYLDLEGSEIPAPTDCGLHVKHPADGTIVKVDVPADCLVVQLGESLQFLSGGHLRATPHCVKSSSSPNFTRETLALFLDWAADEKMRLPQYSLSWEEVVRTPYLPSGVPELEGRVKGAENYRDFATRTFHSYYN